MKATTFLFSLLFISNLALAQFGITGRYHLNNAPDWIPFNEKNAPDPYQYLGNGWSVGIDYWLRLKNYRIEFLPELNYASFENALEGSTYDVNFKNQFYSFFLNTNFYLFDFAGDCNCPTFSKQGQFLKKGFFVQVSPGITRMENGFEYTNEPTAGFGKEFQSTDWSFSIGAGAGLDIGLSDFVTFSPIVSVRYFPNAKWSSFENYFSSDVDMPVSSESAIWQWSAGARLGVRLDYQSNRRRR